MVNIGKFNRLSIKKRQDIGVFLDGGRFGEILMPKRYVPADCEVGDELEVFIYLDSEARLVATSETPLAQVGDIAWLKAVSVDRVGAFLDWGLPKDLLVPFSEQQHEMEVGRFYLAKIFLDEINRIAASTRIDSFVEDTAEEEPFFTGQKVSLLIADKTELGTKAIINHSHWGMLYDNEMFQPVRKGQTLTGYIKKIRDDNKIDLCLHEPGYKKVGTLTEQLLVKLKESNGFLNLNDKSPPEEIYATFGVSKKVFKQAIGALYKKRLIAIEVAGVRLL